MEGGEGSSDGEIRHLRCLQTDCRPPCSVGCFRVPVAGKFFFDLTTVFGSKSAPANFDAVPETIVNIVCTLTGVSWTIVHRQLDDVPAVSPATTNFTRKFAEKFVEVCQMVGLPLAEDCLLREKSFETGTSGTVLGI